MSDEFHHNIPETVTTEPFATDCWCHYLPVEENLVELDELTTEIMHLY